jgi:hypothetical protein
MGGIRRIRRQMYREAIASGDPSKVVKRAIRKRIYRRGGSLLRGVFRTLGL